MQGKTMPKRENLDSTKKLMSALLRQPPKPHEKMKLGRKTKGKQVKLKRNIQRD